MTDDEMRAELADIKMIGALAAGNAMFAAQTMSALTLMVVRSGVVPRDAVAAVIDAGLLVVESNWAIAPPLAQLASDVARRRSEFLLRTLQEFGASGATEP